MTDHYEDLIETESLESTDYIGWNDDEMGDIKPTYTGDLQINSRDWTIETIVNQIEQSNIELNPKFQRRNAWNDARRSMLIESLMIGIPIPEIILAEDPKRKRAFIVIDGKQRLLTIAGFINPDRNIYWDNPKVRGLQVRKELNGMSFSDLEKDTDLKRELFNSTIRCSFISNYRSQDVLFDIFYRLNTGSVALSTQELRQVLNRGDFADYLIDKTNINGQPIHHVLGLKDPDKRLRDVELILRFISLKLFGSYYRSNLASFLDNSMKQITAEWNSRETEVDELYDRFNSAISLLIDTFGDYKYVGRKFTNKKWERRFNKVLLEVEAYYFLDLLDKSITQEMKSNFVQEFQTLCNNPDFRSSIESSTKNNAMYITRFRLFAEIIKSVFSIEPSPIPVLPSNN